MISLLDSNILMFSIKNKVQNMSCFWRH